MDKLLRNISLDKDVEDALLSKPSPYWAWLSLVEDIELGNWDDVFAFLDSRQLDREASAACYTRALKLTQELLRLK